MSAWMVTAAHIDVIVSALLHDTEDRRRGACWSAPDVGQANAFRLDPTDTPADLFGRLLWAENAASVRHRYADADRRGMIPDPVELAGYKARDIAGALDPVAVLKAVACYEYQSCEHPGWETSRAAALCAELRRALCCQLPGFDAAPWGITDSRQAAAVQP